MCANPHTQERRPRLPPPHALLLHKAPERVDARLLRFAEAVARFEHLLRAPASRPQFHSQHSHAQAQLTQLTRRRDCQPPGSDARSPWPALHAHPRRDPAASAHQRERGTPRHMVSASPGAASPARTHLDGQVDRRARPGVPVAAARGVQAVQQRGALQRAGLTHAQRGRARRPGGPRRLGGPAPRTPRLRQQAWRGKARRRRTLCARAALRTRSARSRSCARAAALWCGSPDACSVQVSCRACRQLAGAHAWVRAWVRERRGMFFEPTQCPALVLQHASCMQAARSAASACSAVLRARARLGAGGAMIASRLKGSASASGSVAAAAAPGCAPGAAAAAAASAPALADTRAAAPACASFRCACAAPPPRGSSQSGPDKAGLRAQQAGPGLTGRARAHAPVRRRARSHQPPLQAPSWPRWP